MRDALLTLGPLDAATHEAALPNPWRSTLGARLREASGVVPDPSGPGYMVPSAAVAIADVSTMAQGAIQGAVELELPGAPSAVLACCESGLVAVTGGAAARVLIAGGGNHVFADPSPGATATFAVMGGACLVARRASDGAATSLWRVRYDTEASNPFSLTGSGQFVAEAVVAGHLDPADGAVTAEQVAAENAATGLVSGDYGVRFATVYASGAVGPASRPYVVQVEGGHGDTYTPNTAAAVDAERISFRASDPADPDIPAIFRALAADFVEQGDSTNRVPVYIDGVRHMATGSWTDIDHFLEIEGGVNIAVTTSSEVVFGDRAALQFSYNPASSKVTETAQAGLGETRGLGVWLTSAPVNAVADVAEAPYVLAGILPTSGPFASPLTVGERNERLAARRSLPEGHLLNGQPAGTPVRCAIVAVTAGRVVMGGLTQDLAVPPGVEDPAAGESYIISVSIRTPRGLLRRWREAETLATTTYRFASNVAYYPDARAEQFDIYREESGTYRLAGTVPLQASATQNAAFASVPDGIDTSAPEATVIPSEAARDADNAVLDVDPALCVATGVGRPEDMNAAVSFAASDAAGEGLLAFVLPDRAVSEGQFGTFPLAVVTASGVGVLQTADDGEPVAVRRLFADAAPVGPRAALVVGGSLLVLCADGLYSVGLAGQGARRLTQAVQPLLADATALGLVRPGPGAGSTGRVEVFISGGAETVVMDAGSRAGDTPRFSTLARARTGYAYGVGFDDSRLWREHGGAVADDGPQALTLAPLDLGLAFGSMGSAAGLMAAGLSGELSEDAAVALSETVGEADEALATVVVRSGRGPSARAERVRVRALRLGVGIAPQDTAWAPGDRLTAVHFHLRAPVRQRRVRALPS